MTDAPLFDPPPPRLPSLWIAREGPDQDIVVSTRMRLARNIDGHHFKSRLRSEEGRELEQHLREVLLEVDPELTYLSMNDLSPTMREVLFERHLVSREHVQDEHPRGVAFNADATTSILVNEEDHLRIQVFAAGLDLPGLGRKVDALDDRLAEHVTYCFTEHFGFLTSCPTNTGTGLRVSVMMHLPALSYQPEDQTGEQGIVKVHNAAQKLGLAVRGMHGESSRAEGDFYQVSNQVTLGRSPARAVEDLEAVLRQVIQFEKETRAILLDARDDRLEDTVWRAWAVLTHARRMASSEALAHLSAIRLGACLGILESVSLATIHELMVAMRPAHLQLQEGRALTPGERDVVRAGLLRDTLLCSKRRNADK